MAVVFATDTPRRRRRRDARENDALILDAATVLAGTEGWHGLLTTRLAAATGLSTAPIRERFHDRGAVGAALWRQRISDTFFSRLAAVVAATPQPGTSDGNRDPRVMIAAMQPFQDHDAVMLAAAELLVMARFDPQVADAVASTAGQWMRTWLTPEPGRLTTSQAARHAFSLSAALGLLLIGRGVPSAPTPIDGPLIDMFRAMTVDSDPVPLPEQRAEHLDLGAVFDTDDPAWDALLQATLDELGTRGYEGATLDIIARSAGYSRGIIQNRYSSKKAIVLDATRRMLAAAVVLNEEYMREIARTHSQGLADAAYIRETMDTGRRLVRSIAFEQIRLAWHDSDIAQAMAEEVEAAREVFQRSDPLEDPAAEGTWHFGLAVGQGVGALADLHPPAATLPYDVVTRALHGEVG